MAFRNLNHLKKFYSSVEVTPVKSESGKQVFQVLLDKRRVKTGDNNFLEGFLFFYTFLSFHFKLSSALKEKRKNNNAVKNEVQAELIKLEFHKQKDYLIPSTMPLYSLSSHCCDVLLNKELRQNSCNRIDKLFLNDTLGLRDDIPDLKSIQNKSFESQIETLRNHFLINLKVF